MTFHLPDSYYDPPEPSPDDVLEEAEWIADSLVAEWAEMGEWELWVSVRLDRGNEPVWEITRVAHDGDVHFGGPSGDIESFDDVEEMRTWLTSRFPFPPEEDDDF